MLPAEAGIHGGVAAGVRSTCIAPNRQVTHRFRMKTTSAIVPFRRGISQTMSHILFANASTPFVGED